jgi:transcriptional regulator with XRE-family HTH domain
MHIGAKLVELRESRGWTQEQLAREAGLPLASVRNYEQGRYAPPWDALMRLAAALGVGREWFWDFFWPCVGQPLEESQKRPRGRPRRTPPAAATPEPVKPGRTRSRRSDRRRRGR